jgi:hypothetical protein
VNLIETMTFAKTPPVRPFGVVVNVVLVAELVPLAVFVDVVVFARPVTSGGATFEMMPCTGD